MKSTKPRMKSNHFAEVGKMSEKKEFEPLDVGATERVDWRTAQGLSKYVHFDENGNAALGKNLEVDGTTKLNGGIEPIHNYRIEANGDIYRLIVLFETYDSLNQSYCSFGFIEIEGDSIYPGFFDDSIANGAVTRFYGVFENKVYDFNGSNITQSVISTTSI